MSKDAFFELLNQNALEEAISMMEAQFQDDPIVQFQLGMIARKLGNSSARNELKSGLAILYRFGNSRMDSV